MCDHLQRPRLIHVLRNVDNGRRHQGKSVNVRCQNGTFIVNSNSVQAALGQFLSGPLANRFARRVPKGLLQLEASPSQLRVFNADHLRWDRPIVRVAEQRWTTVRWVTWRRPSEGERMQSHLRVSRTPFLLLALVFVLFPKVQKHRVQLCWCSNLLVPNGCVIL